MRGFYENDSYSQRPFSTALKEYEKTEFDSVTQVCSAFRQEAWLEKRQKTGSKGFSSSRRSSNSWHRVYRGATVSSVDASAASLMYISGLLDCAGTTLLLAHEYEASRPSVLYAFFGALAAQNSSIVVVQPPCDHKYATETGTSTSEGLLVGKHLWISQNPLRGTSTKRPDIPRRHREGRTMHKG